MAASEIKFQRYAIYLAPQGDALATFGAQWLGWDIHAGEHVSQLQLEGLPCPMPEITARPQRYGFHATIVPPFHLAEGVDQAALARNMQTACAKAAPLRLDGLEMAQLGRFLALVPKGDTGKLNDLATAMLRQLDILRAPASHTTLERHRAKGLSAAQDALLERWGYPYVLEAFRFHITLTGKLPKAQAKRVSERLEPVLEPVLPAPFWINQLALVGEDSDGWFHVIRQFDLGGGS